MGQGDGTIQFAETNDGFFTYDEQNDVRACLVMGTNEYLCLRWACNVPGWMNLNTAVR